jgi:hypothetical protein
MMHHGMLVTDYGNGSATDALLDQCDLFFDALWFNLHGQFGMKNTFA